MGFKDIITHLFQRRESVEHAIYTVAISISKQYSQSDASRFMDTVEGMISAGELPLAVHSLRTAFDELECADDEIQLHIKDLEERFGKEIDRLLRR